MKPCKLTITTVADGVENSITRDGEMELSATRNLLAYREEGAFVRIQLQGQAAELIRQGDYTLRLSLKDKEETVGEIGFGGTGGEIGIYTHKLAYSTSSDALLLSIRYDLLISGEKQEMSLRLISRWKGQYEN